MANIKEQRVSVDRFGNSYSLKFAPQQSSKDGETFESYKAYFELGGKLYKVEASKADKTKEIRGVETCGMWLKVTKVKARPAGEKL